MAKTVVSAASMAAEYPAVAAAELWSVAGELSLAYQVGKLAVKAAFFLLF